MINKLGPCPAKSHNVYFDNNEKASTSVLTSVFCFTRAEHNLIKLKLYNNWSAQAVNSISECDMWNSKKPVKFIHL